MDEFEFDEDFLSEEIEEEVIQELLEMEIYKEQTSLDGILEAAQKSLDETKARVAELKTSFGDEQSIGEVGENHLESNEIIVDSTDDNIMEDENLAENENATCVNDSPLDLAGKVGDTGSKELPQIEKKFSDGMSGSVTEPASMETTHDVSLPTLGLSHDDTKGKQKADAPSTTNTPSPLVHGSNEATLDASLPPLHHDKVETSHQVEIAPVSDGSDTKTSGSSDVEVWNDDFPLPSSDPTCSECQSSDDVHSSGAEAISTSVSTTGYPPECEEPRFRSVGIEDAMSPEQVGHLPTAINEDGTDNVVGEEGFSHKVEDGEISVTDNSLVFKKEEEQENNCKSRKKSKKKEKKTKVEEEDKRSKDEKTKSKKFLRRLASLICCCFGRSPERNDQHNEKELKKSKVTEHNSTTTKKSTTLFENASESSFVTVELND